MGAEHNITLLQEAAQHGAGQFHSIDEIKSMKVDKIENLEPPLAHMIPEGAGHIVLPIVSSLPCCASTGDWRWPTAVST